MKPNLTIHQHIDHYRREWPNGLAEVLHRMADNKEKAKEAAELLPEVPTFRVHVPDSPRLDLSDVPLVKPKAKK